jgi:hypothetical protein
VLQAVGNTFPCQAVLFRWQKAQSAACLLCGHPAETVAHIQCLCPALKDASIRAHHNLAGMLWQRVERLQSKWQVVREITVAGLLGLQARRPSTDVTSGAGHGMHSTTRPWR